MNPEINTKLEKFSVRDQWALVTGAAGLLGVEHSRALAEIGANLVLQDINGERLLQVKDVLCQEFPDREFLISQSDVSSEIEISELCQRLTKDSIVVSILINNAAINPRYDNSQTSGGSSRFEKFELADWDRQLKVGLTGAFICSKVFGSVMSHSGGGVIVNIASDLSLISPNQSIYERPNVRPDEQSVKPVTYSVIKSGLIGLTMYLATYWSKFGIRVNALSPGGVFENQDTYFISKLTELIPLGRMAKVEEYRSAIQFLCSDASSYMTGQNLVMDGGRTVW
jgi:NAD(P)-dependent dehydrogenase (short-subunit alcohol dehydrogenase family)